jgi:hypothetical protein
MDDIDIALRALLWAEAFRKACDEIEWTTRVLEAFQTYGIDDDDWRALNALEDPE